MIELSSPLSSTLSPLRTGLGFDAHRFSFAEPPKPLWLACLLWEGRGLEGDSDADVVAHAIIDALLSAAQLGDIGTFFGVGGQSRAVAMHGDTMLSEVSQYISEHSFELINVSAVIIGNSPRISARKKEAEIALSKAAGCAVSLSATTTDSMGFTGAGEGLAAMATALISYHG